jgi:hypothetical protein
MWLQTFAANPYVYMSQQNLWDHIKLYLDSLIPLACAECDNSLPLHKHISTNAAPIWPNFMHKCIARNVHLKFLLGAADLT